MPDYKLHPWDERIGRDASITIAKARRGKRIYTDKDTFVSSVNLPLYRPSLEPVLKRTLSPLPQIFTSEKHIWKTYRESINHGTDESTRRAQDAFRAHLRQQITDARLKLSETHNANVSLRRSLLSRQEAHRAAEMSASRLRCAVRGIEGLARPQLRSPSPDVMPPADLVAAYVKRMSPAIPQKVELYRPFGPAIGAKCEPAERWQDKTFS